MFQLGLLIFFLLSSQSNLSTMAEIVVQSNWSHLETDLLELIFKKLAFDDVVRVKAVCHSWNTYVQSRSLPRILLLMFPGNENHEPNTLGFFNLKEKRLHHKVNKNIFFGARTCRMDSTQGWIVIFDKGTPKVYNPFSGYQILLPPLNIHPSNSMSFRVIVSSDPYGRKDYIVVAIHYNIIKDLTTLMFYKPAGDDNKWTKAIAWDRYLDIICVDDKLLGLTSSRTLDVWDFSCVPNQKAPVLAKAGVIFFESHPLDWLQRDLTHLYLVESLGEIFIVRRTTEIDENCSFKSLTIGLCVYKLDYSKIKWTPIHTLLPGRTILLSSGGSTCVSVQDYPELEENSIYYVDNDCLGVYNLKERKFRRHKFENLEPKRHRLCPPVLVIRPNT